MRAPTSGNLYPIWFYSGAERPRGQLAHRGDRLLARRPHRIDMIARRTIGMNPPGRCADGPGAVIADAQIGLARGVHGVSTGLRRGWTRSAASCSGNSLATHGWTPTARITPRSCV